MLIIKNSVDKDMIEKKIRASKKKIPDEYLDFLLTYNGGETPNTSISVEKVSTDIRAFYGIGLKGYELHINDITKYKIGKKMLLPIAVDSYGYEFCLDIETGTGVYWIERIAEDKMDSNFIAKSFGEFISYCKSKPISEASKRTPEEREKKLIESGKAANISDGLRALWKEEYEKFSKMEQIEVKI